jgi:hypothetical protein
MLQKYIAVLLLFLLFISNVHAANQVVDTTKSPTTFIDTTANGVDLINIANPNSVGVSINHIFDTDFFQALTFILDTRSLN